LVADAQNAAPVAQSSSVTPATAVRFDALADALSRTGNLPPISSFTMMGWFRIQGDTTAYSTFMALGPSTNGTNAYRVMRCCGNGWQDLFFQTGNGGGIAGRLNTPNGAWYHLAVTVEGTGAGQVKTYINGVRTATTYAGNPANVAQKMFIGNDGRAMWLNGSAAAVKVYDIPLTQAEIAQEMQQFAPVRAANLNAFYPLQSAATAMIDLSGNGNGLTVSGVLATDPNGPPLMTIAALATPEDVPLSGTLPATDPDGNPLTFSIVSNATKGNVVIVNPSTGAFTYTPNPDATGNDTFSFKANDGLLDSNVATIAIAISPVDDPPVALDGSLTVPSGLLVNGTLVASDVDSASRTFSIVANGSKGTATITNAATGAYAYTAAPGSIGSDSFTFRANDGSTNSNVATVSVTITPSPVPVPYNGTLTSTEDTAATGTLVATDPNGLALTYSIVANGPKGTAVISNAATGAYTYTPAANATGADSFTFRVSNGTHQSNVATISVTIGPVNDAPVALNGSTTVDGGASVSGTLGATDIDSTGYTFALASNGAKGTATITNPSTGAYIYTANNGSSGLDTFSFSANDGSLNSNVATVTVTITVPPNRAPVAQGGATNPATAVRFDAAGEGLSRTGNLPSADSFTIMGWFRILGDTTSYSSFMALGTGTNGVNTYRVMRCCGNGWQDLFFQPTGGIAGSLATPVGAWYHLALTVAGSGAGQVKTFINGVQTRTYNGDPTIPAERFHIGNDGRGFWLNGSAAAVKVYDVPLTQTEIAAEMQQFLPVRSANLNGFYPLQSAGAATVDLSGYDRTLTMAGTLTTDPNGPPIGVPAPLMATEDTPISDILTATDLDANPLTYSIVTNGTKGTVVITNPATGAFTYTPNANATGADTFSFKANDGALDSNVATVTVLVSPVNDAPVASNGLLSVTSGQTVQGAFVATDLDSSNLTYSIVTNGLKGTATVTNAATGAFAYEANGLTSGPDTITFSVSDGSLSSNVGIVTVSIAPSPAPFATSSTLVIDEDSTGVGSVVAIDPNNLPLTYSIVTNGTKGTAVITNPTTGSYLYTASANATGSDSFTFRASNGTHLSNTGTVAITISPVNDAPIAVSGVMTVREGRSANGRLFATDVDSSSLTFSIVSNGTKGTATITNASTGAFSYAANANESGTDTITFVANDGALDSYVTSVTITITSGTSSNSAPVPLSMGGPPASVRFAAVDDELYSLSNLPSSTSFTMMGWFRYLSDTNSYSSFFRLGHATTSNGYNLLRCCGNGWRALFLWNGASIGQVASSLTIGTWYHFAVTVEGSGPGQVKSYVNGALALTSDGNPNVTADRLSIGNDAHLEWLDGNAAAVKIYDVPLTQAQIAQEIPHLRPVRTADLNSWYPLQSTDNATGDFSGNNRALTMTGALTTDSAGPPIQTIVSTPRNTSLSGTLMASDADNDPLTFALVAGPPNGSVSVLANGSFTYTPNPGFTGSDTFAFSASDGLATASATVTVTVLP
jgi:hypothetical protein